MFLKQLLSFTDILSIQDPSRSVDHLIVKKLCLDSRQALPGSLFFALPGLHHDGAAFAQEAVERGAVAVVTEQEGLTLSVPTIRVAHVRKTMSLLAASFYEHPSHLLSVCGVTGTNGKTTTAYLVQHLCSAMGRAAGLIGTVECILPQKREEALRTTPESIHLQEMLASMRDGGFKAVAMEVASHALVQHRVEGIEFDVAVFTNLTQDHLDYHETMEAYFEAKATLFEQLSNQQNKKGRAIINGDDRYGRRLVDRFSPKNLPSKSTDAANNCVAPVLAPSSIDYTLSCCVPLIDSLAPARLAPNGAACGSLPSGLQATCVPCSSPASATLKTSSRLKTITFGQSSQVDFRASDIRCTSLGTTFCLTVRKKSYLVRSPLIGLFNVYNVLGALAAVTSMGLELRRAIKALESAPQIPGRLQRLPGKRNFHVFVDYAHTPDALENVLQALKQLEPQRLVVLFGCGGDRDRSKRPLMAAAVEKYADKIVVTSDNPRSENPQAIIEEIERGFHQKRHRSIVDRQEAIRTAIEEALPGDLILLAGKGHETYQEIAGVRLPFDDLQVAQRALKK